MFLVMDIGNTNIKIGLFNRNEKLFCDWRIPSDKRGSTGKYENILRKLFEQHKLNPAKVEAVIVCSVSPCLTKIFDQVLSEVFAKRPLVLGRDITAPIKNFYKDPRQVGQDRLVNAVAGFSRYGGPLIIIDFGTALTFDLVSVKGAYMGGVIVPGIEVSLNALIANADLLPKVDLSRPGTLLGLETSSSIRNGIIYGYSFIVEGMVRELSREFKEQPRVVATGGAAQLISRYCKSIKKIEPDLTLEGLWFIYKKASQSS